MIIWVCLHFLMIPRTWFGVHNRGHQAQLRGIQTRHTLHGWRLTSNNWCTRKSFHARLGLVDMFSQAICIFQPGKRHITTGKRDAQTRFPMENKRVSTHVKTRRATTTMSASWGTTGGFPSLPCHLPVGTKCG